MKTENSTDKFFRDTLRNHGVTPSACAWETLEKALDQEPKPKGFAYKKGLVAVAILLTVSSGIWYASEYEKTVHATSIIVNDSLKSTKNQPSEKTKKNTPNDTGNVSDSEMQIAQSGIQIRHENNLVMSSKKSTHSPEKSRAEIAVFSEHKTQKSSRSLLHQTIDNQSDGSKKIPDSLSVSEQQKVKASSTKTEENIEQESTEKLTKNQSHQVEIIIKMGNEAGNRQSPRNKEISAMFPEADSIEKVQKEPASHLGRVFKQVKNFKNGEKVDLNQLKKNPDSEQN